MIYSVGKMNFSLLRDLLHSEFYNAKVMLIYNGIDSTTLPRAVDHAGVCSSTESGQKTYTMCNYSQIQRPP